MSADAKFYETGRAIRLSDGVEIPVERCWVSADLSTIHFKRWDSEGTYSAPAGDVELVKHYQVPFDPEQEARIRELIVEYFTNAGRINGARPALSYYEYLRDRDEPPAAPPARPVPNTTERL